MESLDWAETGTNAHKSLQGEDYTIFRPTSRWLQIFKMLLSHLGTIMALSSNLSLLCDLDLRSFALSLFPIQIEQAFKSPAQLSFLFSISSIIRHSWNIRLSTFQSPKACWDIRYNIIIVHLFPTSFIVPTWSQQTTPSAKFWKESPKSILRSTARNSRLEDAYRMFGIIPPSSLSVIEFARTIFAERL